VCLFACAQRLRVATRVQGVVKFLYGLRSLRKYQLFIVDAQSICDRIAATLILPDRGGFMKRSIVLSASWSLLLLSLFQSPVLRNQMKLNPTFQCTSPLKSSWSSQRQKPHADFPGRRKYHCRDRSGHRAHDAHTVADVLNTVTGVEMFNLGGPGTIGQASILGSASSHVTIVMDG